jgi:multidrug efflux pump subunit AcrA (membrane-fusion protein)
LDKGSLGEGREPSGTETRGIVELVSPTMDPSTETVRVRLALENRDGKLSGGAHALVLLGP